MPKAFKFFAISLFVAGLCHSEPTDILYSHDQILESVIHAVTDTLGAHGFERTAEGWDEASTELFLKEARGLILQLQKPDADPVALHQRYRGRFARALSKIFLKHQLDELVKRNPGARLLFKEDFESGNGRITFPEALVYSVTGQDLNIHYFNIAQLEPTKAQMLSAVDKEAWYNSRTEAFARDLNAQGFFARSPDTSGRMIKRYFSPGHINIAGTPISGISVQQVRAAAVYTGPDLAVTWGRTGRFPFTESELSRMALDFMVYLKDGRHTNGLAIKAGPPEANTKRSLGEVSDWVFQHASLPLLSSHNAFETELARTLHAGPGPIGLISKSPILQNRIIENAGSDRLTSFWGILRETEPHMEDAKLALGTFQQRFEAGLAEKPSEASLSRRSDNWDEALKTPNLPTEIRFPCHHWMNALATGH